MSKPNNDIVIDTEKMPKSILFDSHIDFLLKMTKKDDVSMEFCKMSGIYWVLTSLDMLGKLDEAPRDAIIDFIKKCHNSSDGGFSSSIDHDSHMLSTLSAIQILALLNRLDEFLLENDSNSETNSDTNSNANPSRKERIIGFVLALQQPDGSFYGDKWGEVDTRFSYTAVAILRLLDSLSRLPDPHAISTYILSCLNFDGGFGSRRDSESHSGQMFCCLGALSILGDLDLLIGGQNWHNRIGRWLSDRQLPSGGLNGRPEKLPDVCYSWWVLSSLAMLGRMRWMSGSRLATFIMAAQDDETGGISDRPGNLPDPFHTLFGLAGLSLLQQSALTETVDCDGDKNSDNENEEYLDATICKEIASRLKPIDPVFCLPRHVLERMRIESMTLC